MPALRDGERPHLGWGQRLLRALTIGLGWSGIGAAVAVPIVPRG